MTYQPCGHEITLKPEQLHLFNDLVRTSTQLTSSPLSCVIDADASHHKHLARATEQNFPGHRPLVWWMSWDPVDPDMPYVAFTAPVCGLDGNCLAPDGHPGPCAVLQKKGNDHAGPDR